MGHGGESTVCYPQHHQSNNHHPHVGGGNNKKSSYNGGTPGQNDKQGSKASRKPNAHSVPSNAHSKPINMCKARQSPGAQNNCYSNSKGNVVTLPFQQHQQAQYHLMKQQSRYGNAATSRQKSYSPPTLHPMPSWEGKSSRTQSPVMPGSKIKEHFYAGARFETHPSHIGLPVPPLHWTAPLQRSQSQPSSPVPTSLPQKGISVDLATLFGNSDSALKSSSFPGERLMETLVKMEEEKKRKQQSQAGKDSVCVAGSLAQAQLKSNDNETDELKKALGLATLVKATPVPVVKNNCGSELSSSSYKDISDQLKTLLKVAA